MNYNAIAKSFLEEIKSGIQYKKLGKPFSVFAFIAMLPIIILSAVQFIGYYVLLFVYNGLASSVEYLERWLDAKKSDVRHATEAVLYFVAMPYIFFCQALLAFFAVVFYFNWFSLMVYTYLATLGGVRWQPFLTTAKFDGKAKSIATTNDIAGKIYSIISFVLFAFVCLFFIIMISGGYVAGAISSFISLHISHIVIANVAIFRKVVISKDGEAVVSASAGEAAASEPVVAVVEEDEDDSLPEL